MGFRDKDGAAARSSGPTLKGRSKAGASAAGRPCDYSGMSYALLREHGPSNGPATTQYPTGAERQYEDGVFNTSADYCETYGHDLATGAAMTAEEYAARDPEGRAIIKAAEYFPPPEEPDAEYPFLLTTGRIVYHFHTRTKTGRAPELNAAAPKAFVRDRRMPTRERSGSTMASWWRSDRGAATSSLPPGISGIEPGVVFLPFHYGDEGDDSGRPPTAANRLTMSGWDPVSKQPHFKYAAVSIRPATAVSERARDDGATSLAGRRSDRQRRETAVPAASGETRR